jgi:hypothetical protein
MQQHEQRTEKISCSDAARVVGNDVRGSGGCVCELEELVVAAVVDTWSASRTEKLQGGSGCALAVARVGGMVVGGGDVWGLGRSLTGPGGGKGKMVKARRVMFSGFGIFGAFYFEMASVFALFSRWRQFSQFFFTSAPLKCSKKIGNLLCF